MQKWGREKKWTRNSLPSWIIEKTDSETFSSPSFSFFSLSIPRNECNATGHEKKGHDSFHTNGKKWESVKVSKKDRGHGEKNQDTTSHNFCFSLSSLFGTIPYDTLILFLSLSLSLVDTFSLSLHFWPTESKKKCQYYQSSVESSNNSSTLSPTEGKRKKKERRKEFFIKNSNEMMTTLLSTKF